MDYNLGEMFEDFRIARGYSLRGLAEDVCSPKTISHFEQGAGQMNVRLFFTLMGKMEATWDEYINLIDPVSYKMHGINRKINQASKYGDYEALQNVHQEILALYNELPAHTRLVDSMMAACELRLQHLNRDFKRNEKYIQSLEDYFMNVEEWSVISINLLAKTCTSLPAGICVSFAKDIIAQHQETSELDERTALKFTACINIVNHLMIHDIHDKAFELLVKIKDTLITDNLYKAKIKFDFTYSLYLYNVGEFVAAKQLIQKIIPIYQHLDNQYYLKNKHLFDIVLSGG
ncbi:MAG: hypothetical protein LBT80_03755 [Lactobacillaceae bacterium]|jgi:Rgg/GadR/MutR family transcriptional activator|nr:hypothetical protein [Lactobacillaceae bacterium]